MEAFTIQQLIAEQAAGERPYLEFLRNDSMSLGLYALPADGVDPQQPHDEDEVYYIVSGQGQITVGDETQPVQPGSLVFVAAEVPHKFHDIREDLKILVFFAPPETD
ncbi:MAG: cupin domain-containing protein [Ardenticatenaceae bacterium]|nr:cupin domain-containing protein [Anaerolineales bacterium]MCB9009006.1 cupin domain-containing protein [Ardenticatenaceae bacterium]